ARGVVKNETLRNCVARNTNGSPVKQLAGGFEHALAGGYCWSMPTVNLTPRSHASEFDEQGLVRIPAPVDPLEPVAEANHNVPILNQVAQGPCWWVGRIPGNRELHDHAIEERDDDFVISPCVVRRAGERRRQ